MSFSKEIWNQYIMASIIPKKCVLYGEQSCEGIVKKTQTRCNNGGYYKQDDKIFCGVHLNKKLPYSELRKPTAEEKKKFIADTNSEHMKTVEMVQLRNISQNKLGEVRLRRIVARKKPILSDGWQAVFPNFYSSICQNRGIILPTLSPMFNRGRINHGQPNLPYAQNIENLWQSARVFTCELDEKGNPGRLFYTNRLKFLNDMVPHRRKYIQTPENKIEYLVWTKQDGTEIRLSYVESRFLYCYFLSTAIKQNPDEIYFLFHLRREGINIEIQGPDALPLIDEEKQNFKDSLQLEYLAPRRFVKGNVNSSNFELDLNNNKSSENKAIGSPFGHEKVILSMFLLEEKEWPWLKHICVDLPDKVVI
jgi:hypothetical protein